MKNWNSSNLACTTLYHHQEFIKPTILSREMMHHFLLENLKIEINKSSLQSELSPLANSCVHNYKQSRSTLTKHEILKKLKSDKNIVILWPDKGNGAVVLDLIQYDNAIKEIISDKTKFKELPEDDTMKPKAKLQSSYKH